MKIIKVLIVTNHKSSTLGKKLKEHLISHQLDSVLMTFQLAELYIDENHEFKAGDDDVIVVFNSETLLYLETKKNRKPCIFFYGLSNEYQDIPPNIPALNLIIVLSDYMEHGCFFGIPNEIVKMIPLELPAGSRFLKSDVGLLRPKKIVYEIGEEELLTAKKVIKVINQNPSLQLAIVTTAVNAFILKDLCNDNISFLHKDVWEHNPIEHTDLFIGSSRSIKNAIRQGIPAFVLGVNGLGGLVVSERLEDYHRTHFRGRIGGTYGEEVPIRLLEILLKDSVKEIEKSLENNEDLVSEQIVKDVFGDHSASVSQIFTQLEQIASKGRAISDKLLFDQLNVKVFGYIHTVKMEAKQDLAASHTIINTATGKIIGTLEDDEYHIFQTCLKGTKIKELYQTFGDYDQETIDDFLRTLWENRIIEFRL